MLAKLYVCQSFSCKPLGGDHLLRDLEDLCTPDSGCEVVGSACVDHCGRGPNVEVHYKGGPKKGKATHVVEGVKSYRHIKELLEKTAGARLGRLDVQIGGIKYEARRAARPQDRLAKLQKAFKALGGEAKASKQPRLASGLLAQRARETVAMGGDAALALKDAQQAMSLSPNFAPAHLAAAFALHMLGQWARAAEKLEEALDVSVQGFGSLDKEDVKFMTKQIALNKPKEEEKGKPSEAAPDPAITLPAPEGGSTPSGSSAQTAVKAESTSAVASDAKRPGIEGIEGKAKPTANSAKAKPKAKAKVKAIAKKEIPPPETVEARVSITSFVAAAASTAHAPDLSTCADEDTVPISKVPCSAPTAKLMEVLASTRRPGPVIVSL
eukprot:TRINITY_DN23392_c0_g1_i1.p1 TRINITY_DN23392_c0_g1~~TRINITY_DN23392_c0_g1_i1.p1  ORF type:complete len:382 (-),score=106.42 TRINITY_DN23392_c0_g1_i1:29-1174(-)